MSKTLKAVLLSGLVFPGCGHFYLKSKLVASVFAGISLVCLYFIINTALDIAQQLSDKILSGEIPLDVAKISQAVTSAMAGAPSQEIMYSSWGLVICWLVAMLDILRVSKQVS